MSHHFVKQLIHVMWATRDMKFVIPSEISNELYRYLSTVVKTMDGHLILADGFSDHIHCLISIPPTQSISSMVQTMKASSSHWIKTKSTIDSKFSWQEGYVAISIHEDRKESVYSYIKNDKQRHSKINYRDELTNILKMQNIPFNEKYLLETTYAKTFLHLIWTTKNRIPFLQKFLRPQLYEVLLNSIKEKKGVVHAIGGIEDHVHVLLETPKDKSISDLVKEVKRTGTETLLLKDHAFEWQTGFGAFSVSLSTVEPVKKYIQNQEEHHKVYTSQQEWDRFILKCGTLMEQS